MTKRDKLDPNSQGYTNALLEDIDDKFQTVLEATAPIPKLQKDVKTLQKKTTRIEGKLDTWEEHIKLIPAIFEEVGNLRKDVEILKEAMKLLDRHDARLDKIEKRLSLVEQRVR